MFCAGPAVGAAHPTSGLLFLLLPTMWSLWRQDETEGRRPQSPREVPGLQHQSNRTHSHDWVSDFVQIGIMIVHSIDIPPHIQCFSGGWYVPPCFAMIHIFPVFTLGLYLHNVSPSVSQSVNK